MADLQIHESNHSWGASPVRCFEGSLDAIKNHVPTFERCSFGFRMRDPIYRGEPTLFDSPEVPLGVNPYFDTIVRQPLEQEKSSVYPIPVGIVSGKYKLLQHHQIIDEVVRTLQESGFDTSSLNAQMDLTALGERMRLQVVLPEQYHLTLDADDAIALRLICTNSVDGSVIFSALMGWFRFVCSNGLIVGTIHKQFRQRHNTQMEVTDIMQVLREGISSATKERGLMKKWHQHLLDSEDIRHWADTTLADKWGVKAAVRALHILISGRDVHLTDPFERGAPSRKSVRKLDLVPGSQSLGLSVFAAAQALAWLAKERRDIQEQHLWSQQIPSLITPLLKRSRIRLT